MSNLDRLNHFVKNPVNLDISRSRFRRPFTHKTTFNVGDLVPVFFDECLPGDTFNIDVSSVIRLLTPAVPTMDNAFLDLYFFFVPNRIACRHEHDWAKVMGENFNGYWAPNVESTLDSTGNMIPLSKYNCSVGSIASYFGLPPISYRSATNVYNNQNINLLPFQAYVKIYNEFFRDQNTQSPIDMTSYEPQFFTSAGLLKANKLHDYFTSVLPAPQKGDSVLLPMAGWAPVVTRAANHSVGSDQASLKWTDNQGGVISGGRDLGLDSSNRTKGVQSSSFTDGNIVVPANLYADLSNATSASVNQLRQAFAIQKLLEKDARGGTRYREMLKSHFGVSIPDLTIQVPEYLGGKRVPINITQVLQTSENGDTPLGYTGAFSNTSFTDRSFVKSFNEYGMIIGLATVRLAQSYSQGIPKYLMRNRRFDYYFPVFANLGEQPVYKKELYVKGFEDAPDTYQDDVFGYQEAWAEYRFHPSMVTGHFAVDSNDVSLAGWTYTTKFSATPVLNSDFMKQNKAQMDRTLIMSTDTQIIADFYFDVDCTRPMPLYSIPGLIDHH